jgi:hypothetical protein
MTGEGDHLFESLPRELIIYIIGFCPKRCWFLLSKRFYDLAFESLNYNSILSALHYATTRGLVGLLEKCLKVSAKDTTNSNGYHDIGLLSD